MSELIKKFEGMKLDFVKPILEYLDPNQRDSAEKILRILETSQNFKWTWPDGTVYYENKYIPDSQIVNLISFSTKKFPVRSLYLPGLGEFLHTIREMKIPMDLLSRQIQDVFEDHPRCNFIKYGVCLKHESEYKRN